MRRTAEISGRSGRKSRVHSFTQEIFDEKEINCGCSRFGGCLVCDGAERDYVRRVGRW